ncbi:hypothetical protein J437_LFUL000434 [Ladona fulva]|uniref:DRBM domain-containing protein n=1 Tax=Ladona fulva TaxID=123851 RepID=A0A8K0K334_LADFU|nr:hypothetical protein J437_LFUL000434 [Ladona fulva]
MFRHVLNRNWNCQRKKHTYSKIWIILQSVLVLLVSAMSHMQDFLLGWCGKKRLKPQFEVHTTGPTGNPKYFCKIRIGGYDYIGTGISTKKKDALEDAARDFVDYLLKNNIISSKEFIRTEPFGGPLPNLSSHRIWSRAVLVLGALAVVYFSSTKDQMGRDKPFALVSETIHHRSQEVSCSEDYKQELKLYNHGCIPKRCGRFVSDSMLSKYESNTLLGIAKKGFALDTRLNKAGSLGAATILDLYSGALTSKRKPGEFIDARRLPGAKELFGNYGIKVFRY